MLKRSSKWIPRLSKWLPKHYLKNYNIPTLSEQFIRACHGLADIQEFYDANPMDIANGIIKSTEDNIIEVERATARLEFWLEPAELEPARLARARARKFLSKIWLGSLELGNFGWKFGSARSSRPIFWLVPPLVTSA